MWNAQRAQKTIQNKLGICISSKRLLQQAVSHGSLFPAEAGAEERRRDGNERLEFLGDLVLDLVIGEALLSRFPNHDEDFLSHHKSRLVSRANLATAMHEHELIDVCRVAKHLQRPLPDSVLANVAEGLIGGLYQEQGLAACQQFVPALLRTSLESIDGHTSASAGSIKNQLQHVAQVAGEPIPSYQTTRSGGSDHAPEFTSTVTVRGLTAQATGANRKQAETTAAQYLLEQLNNETGLASVDSSASSESPASSQSSASDDNRNGSK
jgi:ribonuclease-3